MLVGYMHLAEAWWSHIMGHHVPLYIQDPGCKELKLHHFISNILEQQQAWKQPWEKREPYTSAMFEALHWQLQQLSTGGW